MTVTDNSGATGKDTMQVTVQPEIQLSVISLKLFPNPAKNSTMLEISSDSKESWVFVKLYNLNGLLVLTKEVYRTDYKTLIPIDVNQLQAGTYFIHVTVSSNNTQVLKMIKR